jgi:hypothetical protein
MGVGGINEMVEFIATLIFKDTNVGGFDNTGWDLVFDLVGATAAGLWSYFRPLAQAATDRAAPRRPHRSRLRTDSSA